MTKDAIAQFDTSIKLYMIAFVFLLSLSAHSAEKCESYFKPNFIARLNQKFINLSSRDTLELSQSQISDLKKILTHEEFKKPYGMPPRGSSPMFWYIWEITPLTIKETITYIIEKSPQNQRDLRKNINSVLEKNGLNENKFDSFLETIISTWSDYVQFNTNPKSFSDWVKTEYSSYLEQIRSGEISVSDLKQSYRLGLNYRKASKAWGTQIGVSTLKTKTENNQSFVQIKDQWYKCQIDAQDKSIKILVPRELVRRAAWNPLYTEVLTKKLASGAKPLKQYPGFLAANAYFYLSDGNHRFAIDTRPEVWIEMSYPAQSSSYGITFDAMGIRQPSVENLLKFNNNEISLADLIGEDLSKAFIFK
jgi:hypothetical protein